MANKKDNKASGSPLDAEILEFVEKMPTGVALNVVDAYQSIPSSVKSALDDFIRAMEGIDDKGGVDAVKDALAKLKEAGEANPYYEDFYKIAKEEANQEIAELYANGGISL